MNARPYGRDFDAVYNHLYRQLVAAEARIVAADAACDEAEDTGDDDAYARAEKELREAEREAADLEARLWEMDECAGYDERRAERSNSPSVI